MPRTPVSKRKLILEARGLQEVAVDASKALARDLHESDDKTERARIATALGNIMANWTKLQDSLRVLKGQPLPGSFKPEPPAKKPTRSAQLSADPTE